MLAISSMITLSDTPRYSHATPVAPAGSGLLPPPATEIGFGRVIPRADPIVVPLGHCAEAVGVGPGAEGVEAAVDVDAGLVLPQAVNTVAKSSAASADPRRVSCTTRNASRASRGLDAAQTRHAFSSNLRSGGVTERWLDKPPAAAYS
jgi:hypothetical protein